MCRYRTLRRQSEKELLDLADVICCTCIGKPYFLLAALSPVLHVERLWTHPGTELAECWAFSGRVPIPTRGQTLWYSLYIRTLCIQVSFVVSRYLFFNRYIHLPLFPSTLHLYNIFTKACVINKSARRTVILYAVTISSVVSKPSGRFIVFTRLRICISFQYCSARDWE